MKILLLLLGAALVGCAAPATLPPRPAVSFFVHQSPLMIPQEPVARPGHLRKIQPPPVAAPICLTDADHLALEAYLDQVDAWRTK